MPSSATITSFYNFAANTKARASQMNNNFDVFRGHIIPVHVSTATSANNTYDLGSSEYRWKSGYFQSLSVSNPIFPMTSSSQFINMILTKSGMDATSGARAMVADVTSTLTSQITINEQRNIEIGLYFTDNSVSSAKINISTTTVSTFGTRISCYRDGTTTCIGRREIYGLCGNLITNSMAIENFKFIDTNVPAGTYSYTFFYESPLTVIDTTSSLQIQYFKMYSRAF